MTNFTVDGRSLKTNQRKLGAEQIFAMLPGQSSSKYHLLWCCNKCPDHVVGDEMIPIAEGSLFETFPRGQWGG